MPDTDPQAQRIAALQDLLAATDTGAQPAPAPVIERTGETVEAGGDVARLLVDEAVLAYSDGGVLHYPEARPGDVVLLTAKTAKRLDEAGVTVDPDTNLEELATETAEGLWTDEQIGTAGAPELIAYVGQNPDERPRVRALEELRPEKKRRATVLKATEPTPELDAEALAAAAGLEVEPPIEETDAGGDPDVAATVEAGLAGEPPPAE